MATKGSRKKSGDVRFICTACPKQIVELSLIGYVLEQPFETAQYQGQCDTCGAEYQLERAQMKEPT